MENQCPRCQIEGQFHNNTLIYDGLRNIDGIYYDVYSCSKCKDEHIEQVSVKKEQDWNG